MPILSTTHGKKRTKLTFANQIAVVKDAEYSSPKTRSKTLGPVIITLLKFMSLE